MKGEKLKYMDVNQNKDFKKKSESKKEKALDTIWNFKAGLLKYGKAIGEENPDNLSTNELVALSIKILKEVENIDRKLGYPPHQIDTPAIAKTVSNSRLEELYVDFLDWYNIIPGPGKSVYDHVLKKYPKEKYNRILCVGDGIKSHLGRKLAMKGYNVVSVDPEADTTLPLDEETLKSGGMFTAAKDYFSHNSHKAIEWADLIVGSKIPTVAEEILKVESKPAVFTISKNPEMYHMTFNGIPIKSAKQLTNLIIQSKGVTTEEYIYDDIEHSVLVFEKGTFEKVRTQTDNEHDSR